ncbi:MAG: crossover junction endodeoxyribonuclease RuvC [Bacteroidota bacterium]
MKKETKRILGIDPGTNLLGYAVIETKKNKISLLTIGVVSMKHLSSHQLKLKKIFERLQEIIRGYQPTEMAVEAPFYGKNVQSMLKLGRAQGVAIAAAITMDVEMTEYSPKKIKQSVTGNGNASKEQVAAMLVNILDQKLDTEYLDSTDALAVAICHHYQSGNALGGGKKYGSWSSFIKDNPNRLK